MLSEYELQVLQEFEIELAGPLRRRTLTGWSWRWFASAVVLAISLAAGLLGAFVDAVAAVAAVAVGVTLAVPATWYFRRRMSGRSRVIG